MKALIRLAWDALFLSEAPYAEMRDSANAVLRGLGLVALIAVAVALVGLVGTTLEWATTPSLRDLRQAVWEGIQQMPWYREMLRDPEFQRLFELGWRILPPLFGAPNIAQAALRIILLPLGLALTWVLYSVSLATEAALWYNQSDTCGRREL